MSATAGGRRAEYAETTRLAIIDAARALFAERGYFATTVVQIARRARVAPATVYAVAGSKQALLLTLVDLWTTDPVVPQTLARIADERDPLAILELTAVGVRRMREDCADIVRVLLATAPHDATIAAALDAATTRYRDALVEVSRHLERLGALGAGATAHTAEDVLWFYFGYTGYATLVDGCGWSYDRAQQWLVAQVASALSTGGAGGTGTSPS